MNNIGRDMLEAALAHIDGDQLVGCPPTEPLPAQVRTFHEAVARCRESGLWLPRVHVFWRDRPGDSAISGGVCWHAGPGLCHIYLDANLFPGELLRVTYHELKHASDFAQGLQCSRVEFEERANLFAAQMLGWCT